MASRKIQVELVGDSSSLERAFARASGAGGKFGGTLKSLGRVAAVGVGAAFAGLAATLKVGFDELAEGQRVSAQTGAVLKSTGGIANVTAKHVNELAQAQSHLTGIDDELIATSENLLLTFKNVRNEIGEGADVFDRATKSALDLSTAGFGSVESASKMMGKALNDPVKGMTALGRAGVTFSEDQKKAIKAMVESNDLLGAQKLILKEVESQVGGSAKAFGETMPGQLAKLKNSFEEVAGGIAETLLPYLTQLLEWTNQNMPTIQRVIQTTLDAVVATIQFLAPIIATLIGWFQKLSAATQEHWPRIQAVIQGVINWFRTNIVPTVSAVVSTLIALWERFGSQIVAVLGPAFKIIFTIISSTMLAIKAIIETVMALIRGDWGKAWEALKSLVSIQINGIKTIISTVLTQLVPAVLGLALSIGKAIVGGIAQGLVNLVGTGLAQLQKLPGILAGLAGLAAAAAVAIGRGIVSGIVSGLSGLFSQVQDKIVGGVMGAINGAKGALGIGSPSKVTRDEIGRPLAEGILSGFLEGSRTLSTAMGESVRNAVSAVQTVGRFGTTDLGVVLPPPDIAPTTDALSVVGESVDVATATVVAFRETIASLPAIASAAFQALTVAIQKALLPLSKTLEEPRLAIQAVADALHAIGRASYATRAALQDTVADIVRLLGKIEGLQGLSSAHLEGRRHGGPVRRGSPYIVGEAGPELFIPQQSGTVVSNSASMAAGSAVGGGGIVVNVYGDVTGAEIVEKVRRGLYDISRRNPGALPGIA